MSHDVTILAFPGVNLLDISGPCQAFAGVSKVRPELASPYKVRVASHAGGPIMTSAAIQIMTEKFADVEDERLDTLIIPGGAPDGPPARPPEVVDFIRRRAAHAGRVCSVSTGAFSLAEAGVLKGRRTTTHWAYAPLFRSLFPDVVLEQDTIFTRDGYCWGSAGITAGVDLALALIQQDLGYQISMEVARLMIVYLKRPGSQSQFSAPLAAQTASTPVFAELHAWMAESLKEDLTIERMAQRCGMSTRTFSRAYSAQVGETPARTVESMRLEAAKRLLENPQASLKRVAVEAGYGDEQNLRRAFLRRLGVTPLDYRRTILANLED